MARYQCPSCGAAYNGKRCRSCYYEHFTEEITHGTHIHAGEPLVIDAPVRRPIRRKNPFDCDEETKKKHKGRFGAILAVLLALSGPVADIAGELVSEAADAFSYVQAEPEPIEIPEDAMTLYVGDGLRILADWKNGREYTDGIRIFAENDTGYDLDISAVDIIVNGYMMESSWFYCDARNGTQSLSTLWLDEEALSLAGISTVEAISFHLEGWDQKTYDRILTTERIVLQAAPPGTDPGAIPAGQIIYDRDGITVSYLGYKADEYHPEEVAQGQLLFHIQNDTQRYLEIFPLEVSVNGENCDVSLWSQVYPGARAVASMYLYPEGALTTLETLELTLEFTDREDYDYREISDPMNLNLK